MLWTFYIPPKRKDEQNHAKNFNKNEYGKIHLKSAKSLFICMKNAQNLSKFSALSPANSPGGGGNERTPTRGHPGEGWVQLRNSLPGMRWKMAHLTNQSNIVCLQPLNVHTSPFLREKKCAETPQKFGVLGFSRCLKAAITVDSSAKSHFVGQSWIHFLCQTEEPPFR